MPIDSICGGCGKTLRVGDEYAGQQAKCPLCGTIYTVASPETDSQPTSALATDSVSDNPGTQRPNDFSDPTNYSNESTGSSSAPDPFQSGKFLAPPESPSLSEQTTAPERFMVKTPAGSEYGPVDANTIVQWSSQGRVNDTCFIREARSSQWIGFAAWRFQYKSRFGQLNLPTVSANEFAAAPSSSLEQAVYARSGNGVLVFIFGILSWLMCVTVFGAPICAIVALILGYIELRAIQEGRTLPKDRTIVLIGMWLAGINLAFCSLFIIFIIGMAIVNP